MTPGRLGGAGGVGVFSKRLCLLCQATASTTGLQGEGDLCGAVFLSPNGKGEK